MSRTTDNGVLQFHDGTPAKLLQYVLDNAVDNDVNSVISTIDKFCWEQHWMMLVGDEKGTILSNEVKARQPMTALDFGTYCGYSTLRMLACMDNPDSKVYTLDVDHETVKNVAIPILRKAGVLHRVVFLSGCSHDVIENIKDSGMVFDLVFIDHEKKVYYRDLLSLEKYGLVNKQTTLVADNVIVFNIDDYLAYVSDESKFNTKIIKTSLEYNKKDLDTEMHEDGVVISTYK